MRRAEERRACGGRRACRKRLETIETQDGVLLDLRRQRRQLADENDAIVVEDALLKVAPELDALLDEAAGVGQALEGLKDLEGRLARRHCPGRGRGGSDWARS